MKKFLESIAEMAIASIDNFSFQVSKNSFIVNGSEMRRIQQQDIESAEFMDLLENYLSVTGEDGKAYLYFPENTPPFNFTENIEITQELINEIDSGLKTNLSSIDDLESALLSGSLVIKSLSFIENLVSDGISKYLSNGFYDFYIVTSGYAKSKNLDIGNLSGTLFLGVLDDGDDLENISLTSI